MPITIMSNIKNMNNNKPEVTIEPEWKDEMRKLPFYNSLMGVEKVSLERFIEILLDTENKHQ